MRTKVLFSIIILFSIPVLTFSQGRKTIKSKQLASKTVYEYFLEEGQKEPIIELFEVYDAEGNIIEIKEINSEGEIKNWRTYKFDHNDNETEERILDTKGNLIERSVSIYKDDLIVEKQYYDKRGRMTKRKEYKYEYRLDI